MLILTSFYFRRLTFLFSQVLFKHGLWRDLSRTEDVPFSLMFFNSSGRERPILLGWQNELFPWVEEKAELLLWRGLCTNHGNTCSDFHQQCINQHMVVLWYVGRRWGVSTNFILTSIRAQAYIVVVSTHFYCVCYHFTRRCAAVFVPAISDPFLTRELMWRLKGGVRSTWTRVALDAARVPRLLLCDIARVMI